MKQLWRNPQFVAVAVIAMALLYLLVSSPGKVVVDTDGSRIGLQNDVRELLQGERFWTDQMRLILHEQAELRLQPERDRRLRAELDKGLQEIHRSTEKFYKDNPAARPSQAELRAEALRDMADRVEDAELSADAHSLRTCRPA
jgi:hypothetical protein